MKYKLRERKREKRKDPRSNAKPKKKIKLTKLKRTQKVRSGGLEKTGYDPKSVEDFEGNCRIVCKSMVLESQNLNVKIMYICGKSYLKLFIYSTFTY